MKVTLLAYTKPVQLSTPASLIEFAGRVCYNSTEKQRSSEGPDSTHFIKARLAEGHESIVEHASVSFLIEGISRACSHQLVRHRLFSFAQESQRYVDQKEVNFVLPPSIKLDTPEYFAYREALGAAQAAYTELRELGVSKEDARFVLPAATMTRLVMSGNLRCWRMFLKLRLAKSAQWEIRSVASRILEELKGICPEVFKDLT